MLLFLRNYLDRHRHPLNRLLHLLGLPTTFVLPWWLLLQGSGAGALTAFLLGYALQFAGHAIEGNDAGEAILVKRLLGRPYTAMAPPHNRSTTAD